MQKTTSPLASRTPLLASFLVFMLHNVYNSSIQVQPQVDPVIKGDPRVESVVNFGSFPDRLTSQGTRSCGAHVSPGLAGGGEAEEGARGKNWNWHSRRRLGGSLFFSRVVELVDRGNFQSFLLGKLSCVWGLLWGKLGDAWCCLGMVDSWWLLWFLVLDLTKSERFKHVQSKHQNVTKHQHDFCVGDLNLNICCSNTETGNFWTWRLSWDRFLAKDVTWLQQVVRIARGLSSRPGTVHFGDRQSLTLDFTSAGDKMFGSCSWWWLVKDHPFLCMFGEIFIDLVPFTLRVGLAQCRAQSGNFANEKLKQRHVHFRGD